MGEGGLGERAMGERDGSRLVAGLGRKGGQGDADGGGGWGREEVWRQG